jgi:hypothetical protein
MHFHVQPKELSPFRIARDLSGFYAFLSRKPARRCPLLQDLTTIVSDDEKAQEIEEEMQRDIGSDKDPAEEAQ